MFQQYRFKRICVVLGNSKTQKKADEQSSAFGKWSLKLFPDGNLLVNDLFCVGHPNQVKAINQVRNIYQ